MDRDEIKTQLDAAGIEYDGRASNDKLEELLPKKQPKGAEVEMRVRRDVWDEDGERVRSGQIVTMSLDDAMEGLESGKLERVKS